MTLSNRHDILFTLTVLLQFPKKQHISANSHKPSVDSIKIDVFDGIIVSLGGSNEIERALVVANEVCYDLAP